LAVPSEQLEIIPAQIHVIRNIRIKYACRACETGYKNGTPASTTDPEEYNRHTVSYLVVEASELPLTGPH
jgi:hypothetical protein